MGESAFYPHANFIFKRVDATWHLKFKELFIYSKLPILFFHSKNRSNELLLFRERWAKNQWEGPKTFLRIGSYYKTTIDNLKIMNHLKLLTKYN